MVWQNGQFFPQSHMMQLQILQFARQPFWMYFALQTESFVISLPIPPLTFQQTQHILLYARFRSVSSHWKALKQKRLFTHQAQWFLPFNKKVVVRPGPRILKHSYRLFSFSFAHCFYTRKAIKWYERKPLLQTCATQHVLEWFPRRRSVTVLN